MSTKRACLCIDNFEKTSGHKLNVLICVSGGPHRALVATVREPKSRKKTPVVVANFCPFCGVDYTKAKGPSDPEVRRRLRKATP